MLPSRRAQVESVMEFYEEFEAEEAARATAREFLAFEAELAEARELMPPLLNPPAMGP